ncbi:MAG TPA: hypothetical protein DCP25_14995 [Chloroflexi bacterium]|nr:hypothetical protein [Chloroflexota bacterium]
MARSGVSDLRAVLFDVDFTLAKPGPELSPQGYARLGARHGIALDPALYEDARVSATRSLKRHPELHHDDEIWITFMAEIVRGMGGRRDIAYACAQDLARAWLDSANFELYADVRPVLAALRREGFLIGLLSNTGRDMAEFVAHHCLNVDATLSSGEHGRVKPDPTIFLALLDRLGVEPAAAVMVGDTIEDDVEGALNIGLRAFLLDRENSFPEFAPRLLNLSALPDALGIAP